MGCLFVLFILLCLLFVGGTAYGVMALMKSSDAYAMSLKKIQADQAVIAELGSPIQEGWYATGNIQVNPASGTANLAYPLSGPKGSATVYVHATKSGGTWTLDTLSVKIDGKALQIRISTQDETPAEVPGIR